MERGDGVRPFARVQALHRERDDDGAPDLGLPEHRRSERGAPDPLARAGSGEQPVAVGQGPFRECDGREDVQPEPLRLDARRGADVHERVIHRERRLRRGGAEAREMGGPDCHHSGHGPGLAEQGDAMPFEHLVLQRGEQGAGHASQPEVTVVRDVADDVPRLVDVAAGEAPRASPTQRDDHVAEAIARAAGQERDERIGHGALEAGDGGPGREAERELVDGLGG